MSALSRAHHRQDPPIVSTFAYETDAIAFETHASWVTAFPYDEDVVNVVSPEMREVVNGALDQGIVHYVHGGGLLRRLAAATNRPPNGRGVPKRVHQVDVTIDPAKSLFLYLEHLWLALSRHQSHPGFDIRTYLDEDSICQFPFERSAGHPLAHERVGSSEVLSESSATDDDCELLPSARAAILSRTGKAA